MAIQFLRGNKSTLEASQQIFLPGQPIYEQDSGQLKIGNGSDIYSALKYVGASSSGGSGGSISSSMVGDTYASLDNPWYIDLGDNNGVRISGMRKNITVGDYMPDSPYGSIYQGGSFSISTEALLAKSTIFYYNVYSPAYQIWIGESSVMEPRPGYKYIYVRPFCAVEGKLGPGNTILVDVLVFSY